MAVHEAPVGATVEWYTPKSLFDQLGLTFDLDPAAAPPGLAEWVPATLKISSVLAFQDPVMPHWIGRVWLNPPYGPAGVPFIEAMIEHNHGLLLVPARTETRIFQKAADSADRVIFLRDRLHFVRPNGVASRASFGSVLMAFGLLGDEEMDDALVRANLGWSVDGPIYIDRQAAEYARLAAASEPAGGGEA